MQVISPFLSFPCISWWMRAVAADIVIFDKAEHFQKMSYRNRYRISGSTNPILLTVPLVKGREQRTPMADVLVHNDTRWQVQHWRSLVSVYKSTPYFDHYEDSLRPLFEREYTHLVDFNRDGIVWVKAQLKAAFEIQETGVYTEKYPDDMADLRDAKTYVTNTPRYYQVFEDRTGFIPDLSILDLLFSEGPEAMAKLRNL